MGSDDRRPPFPEHTRISALAEHARPARRSVEPDAEVILSLSAALDAHTRWKEREVSPRGQDPMTPERSEAMSRETARIESSRNRQEHRGQRDTREREFD